MEIKQSNRPKITPFLWFDNQAEEAMMRVDEALDERGGTILPHEAPLRLLERQAGEDVLHELRDALHRQRRRPHPRET